MCLLLQVSRSGYYAWSHSSDASEADADATLLLHIKAIHTRSRGAYGSPRVFHELRRQGLQIGKKRVERLMRENGLFGRTRRRFLNTTIREDKRPAAPDLLQRNFTADRPNQKWVTDLTSMWCDEGWLYLSVLMDRFSNRVVGYAMADHMRVELPLEALKKAVAVRRIDGPLVHHSDRGSQYTSAPYQLALNKFGMQCSMSRKGQCWDNAAAESLFGRIKEELFHGRRWRTRAELQAAIENYIDCFYNAQRIQKRLDYLSPVEYELRHAAAQFAA